MSVLPPSLQALARLYAISESLAMVHPESIQQKQEPLMPTKRVTDNVSLTPPEPDDADTDQGDEIEVAPLKVLGEVLRIIHGFDQFTPPTDEQIRQEMLNRKLNATSADELLAGADATPLEELFQEPIMIRDYHMVQSAEQFDQPVFFVLDITHRGKARSVTTGAMDVMESVAIAKARGFLPMMAVAYKQTEATKNGFHPVKLRQFHGDDEPF